jgi:hypothetical protein
VSFLNSENVGSVSPHSGAVGQTTLWVEEELFGHRLWARQTPWLLFLEFLNVAEAFLRDGTDALFSPTRPDEMRPYTMRYRMGLRYILFDNEDLVRISSSSVSDQDKWTQWLGSMEGRGINFDYLKSRFQKFDHFSDLVALVRNTTLEAETRDRRWSSRFVFPFGVSALYSDAKVGANGPQPDFNNFGRTGEILYMMLSRSSGAGRLRVAFSELLALNQPKNLLVSRLCAPGDDNLDRGQKGETYLPYKSHPAFERLASDWLAVLDRNLPEQDAYAHLVPLSALHILLYQLETSAGMLGQKRPHLVCEMIAPRKEFVRQRSIASFQDNDAKSNTALMVLIDEALSAPEWQDVVLGEYTDAERLKRGLEFLERRFSYKTKTLPSELNELIDQFKEDVEEKHVGACGRVHRDYSRYIGLSSARGTNRVRYAPTDNLLKTLVVARVPRRLEFKRFLADLYVQYGFVLGEAEALLALDPEDYDASAFERNRMRLEARMGSMGMLIRLSDGCAYVINPFASDENPNG